MKKKVLFILHLPPPIHGAAMVGQYLMESKSINETFEADFINLTTAFDLEKMGKFSTRKVSSLLRIQFKVTKALLQRKYDLCYVSLNAKGSGFYKDFLVVVLLKLFGKKIVYHFHNRGVATMQHKKINHWLYQYTFRNTSSILLSPLLYSDLKKYVTKENLFYCSNGIPVTHEKQRTDKSGNSLSVCQILFLSNMIVEKGVYVLLAACKRLKEENIPFVCHFVGAWTEVTEDQLQEAVNHLGLERQIMLHGKKTGAAKAAFLRDADIFVFPTFYHNECFPLVNLEAMQFSLPIITTTIGGIPDMIIDGKTGYLVPPQDDRLLAVKIAELIHDPVKRRKMGVAGRSLYEERFTLEKFESNIKNVLNAVIAN